MTERPNVPVLKTGVARATVGSNPTLSAIYLCSMATKRNKQPRKVSGRSENIRSGILESAKKASALEGHANKSRWSYISISMHKFMVTSANMQEITPMTLVDCISFLKEHTAKHMVTQKYGLCTILVSGIETWLHSRHARKELTLTQVGSIIAGPVKLAEVLDAASKKHPWAPGHEYGRDFWNLMKRMFFILESESVTQADKILVLESLKETHGLLLVKSLIDTNYFGGQ